MTPKQVLRAHIDEWHRRQPGRSWTYAQLQKWHAGQHHRYTPRNHYHVGDNRGPDARPPGWRTGEDTVAR